jgi:hypothetical protein
VIRYCLTCDQGHRFESWFDSSDAYDKLQQRKLVECPECGSSNTKKALMTPQINTGSDREKAAPEMDQAEPDTQIAAAPDPRLAQMQSDVLDVARQIRNHIRDNADYVGNEFAEEARRIHYDESEDRGIYGEATRDELHDLTEEGIEVLPLPVLPEDKN